MYDPATKIRFTLTMKIRLAYPILVLCVAFTLMSYNSFERTKSIEGTWIRKTDNLMVRVDANQASILQEGDEKFPCDIAGDPIYKNIVKVNDNLWTCQFLVVTRDPAAKRTKRARCS